MTDNQVIEDALLRHLATELAKKGVAKTRAEVFHGLSAALKHAAHTQMGDAVRHSVAAAGHTAAGGLSAVTGTAAGHMLGQILYKLLAHNIHAITAKLLASAAVKKLVMVMVHKSSLALITAIVVKISITKLGVTKAGLVLHGTTMHAIPVFLAYKIFTLPRSLAEKIAEGVRDAMDEKFTSILDSVLTDVPKTLFGGDALVTGTVGELIQMDGWKHMTEEAVGGFPTGDTAHFGMEKDVSKTIDGTKDIIKAEWKVKKKAHK